MKPEFCVILTTYNRPDSVLKSVKSVIGQNYDLWRLVIVIDDITSNYVALIELAKKDGRISIISNSRNIGKNSSINWALSRLRDESFRGYVIYLDDDDWLSPNCLDDFADGIKTYKSNNWLVSSRVNIRDGVSLTKNYTGDSVVNYKFDYLLRKKFTGDATHCLSFDYVKNIRFPEPIKNGEEWIYFSSVSMIFPSFRYICKNGTFSNGYSVDGLSSLYQKHTERKKNNLAILRLILKRRLFSPWILLYYLGRVIRSSF
ncbi:MAG: hypothetical protein COU06_00440 [Candidatus Harrisonbacteria bacterium CG10_big_fil_rev_8_21_14_0_10_38_8]|uniref:Glycosyltransferase 2-like domain-containing protein n=1 Tax=Candidatus Harrisonbacteria bacterium CG10_big_fil_rev_8_21_14_0_10_38_8 TaxID=1974582 RepID=A0A2M6WKM8_9BACT|nr:MAG: hypothetical protein COU06_00440 [Candidatus Harrisonbacteria bacterium CG10_big_fil_rev_8_21_14_0_10_38_8]